MTMLLLHGLTRCDAPTPEDAPPHLRIAAGHLVALATTAATARLADAAEPPVAEAMAHHRLLSAYAARSDVLPVRFGTAFSGRPGLSSALMAEEAVFFARLGRLSRRVEYVMTLTAGPGGASCAPAKPGAPPEGGRAFLAEKRALRDELRSRAARRAAFARDLPANLAPVAVDIRQLAPRKEHLAEYALLVARKGTRELLRAAEVLAARADTLNLSLSLRGPGPCYAFATEPEIPRRSEPAEAAPGRRAHA